MALRHVNLALNVGASYQCAFAWIAASAGVDASNTAPTATFRQTSADTPLVTLTSSPSSLGAVTFLTAIPNFAWLPKGQTVPVLVTLYPIQLALTVAGVAALLPYQEWSLLLTYPDTTVFPFIEGQVTVGGV